MPVYLFSVGNSDTGAIGACIRVHAENAESALTSLAQQLADHDGAAFEAGANDESFYEYATCFINPQKITLDECIRSETQDCDRIGCPFCGNYDVVGRDECTQCFASLAGGHDSEDRCLPCAGATHPETA